MENCNLGIWEISYFIRKEGVARIGEEGRREGKGGRMEGNACRGLLDIKFNYHDPFFKMVIIKMP